MSTKRFEKILIANRGEIARRIIRTCQAHGYQSVAIYSACDANAPHVREADEAYCVGEDLASASYLNIARILWAAKQAGAQAVHPGYGFLSENADFAQACQDAGLVFIGPRPEVIAKLGSKQVAKHLAAKAGVPTVPGYSGSATGADLVAEAQSLGFPLLLKASAGGGGKGMRVVEHFDQFAEFYASAQREARSAFGDDTLLLERYIENPRHIEVQIIGDEYGHVLHLFERECSLQRRHQKVIEEAPSPSISTLLRERLVGAAVALAKAIGYSNAGTVEFIVTPSDDFYFLEVNTRIQVEHPVTECITGLDIVALQLQIAQGEPLTLSQDDVHIDGAALECRLYAEDPSSAFVPQAGRIVDWDLQAHHGVRIDSALDGPDTISVFYDPMLAKLISHAQTRAKAIDQMRQTLRRSSILGIVTNQQLLEAILDHEQFRNGRVTTDFIEKTPSLVASEISPNDLDMAVIAAHLVACQLSQGRVLPQVRPAFRSFAHHEQYDRWLCGEVSIRVARFHTGANAQRFEVNERVYDIRLPGATKPPECVFEVALDDGCWRRHAARVCGEGAAFFVRLGFRNVALTLLPRQLRATSENQRAGCLAPMPAMVVRVLVTVGQQVREGESLVVLEAMKMEHSIKADRNGLIEAVHVMEGHRVEANALLVSIADGA